jgi:hypothetical protein
VATVTDPNEPSDLPAGVSLHSDALSPFSISGREDPEGPGGKSSEAVGRQNTREPSPTPLGVPRLCDPGTETR